MSSELSYDPVSAVDESDATGAVAETFRDIRQTMNIPIVTSIWRGLAGMDNGLEKVWLLAKPIYQNANPGAKLNEIISNINLTLPEDLTESEIINNDFFISSTNLKYSHGLSTSILLKSLSD